MRAAGKGRWRVQLSVGNDPVTSKRRRIDKTVSGTKREAEAELNRLIVEYGEGGSTGVDLDHYLTEIWLPHMKPPRVRERTWENYDSKLRKHVIPYIGKSGLDELTPLRIDSWLVSLRKKGVSAHTSLHAFRVLKAALQQAVKWRLMTSNPMDAVERPRPAKHELEVFTTEEVQKLLKGAEGTILEPAIALAVGTGMRRSEISGLKWSDVDLLNGTVHVRRGRHQIAGKVIEEPPKTEHSHRIVSLPAYALEPIKRHAQTAGYVVTDENGAPIPPGSLSKRYAKLRDGLGLRAVPFRDLRHTHATLALEAGVDVVVVSRRLGHSNVTTTDSFYLRPGRAADEVAAGMLDDLLAPSRAKQKVAGVTRLKASSG